MKDLRSGLATAVALSVLMPLLIVVYLLTLAIIDELSQTWLVIALTVLGIVLLLGGLNMISTLTSKYANKSGTDTE